VKPAVRSIPTTHSVSGTHQLEPSPFSSYRSMNFMMPV
jgi:hypothetical protein